jgi:hypothetical protein
LSEFDDEPEDFSVDFGFSAGLSDDFSVDDEELDESLLPPEPLMVLFEESRLSLR